MSNRFPTVRWKSETATFRADDIASVSNPLPAPAALVFPFYGDRIVLADIPSRGWCIPSGHIEAGESPEMAVRREAWEEAGVTLGNVEYIGYFILTSVETHLERLAPTFIGDVRGIEPIPQGSESRGMQMVNVEDVSGLYFAWDALLSAVFDHAAAEKQYRLRSGTPISALFGN